VAVAVADGGEAVVATAIVVAAASNSGVPVRVTTEVNHRAVVVAQVDKAQKAQAAPGLRSVHGLCRRARIRRWAVQARILAMIGISLATSLMRMEI
jgi:hypothetical protein